MLEHQNPNDYFNHNDKLYLHPNTDISGTGDDNDYFNDNHENIYVNFNPTAASIDNWNDYPDHDSNN